MNPKKQKEEAAPTYSKAQLLASDRFLGQKDILTALLEEKEAYTIEKAKGLIDDYMKGTVK